MKTYATYNIKGGVGKTSTAVNLAYLAAREGRRTLLWDLDPQGAATFLFRVRPRVKGGGRALVRGRRPLEDAVKGSDFDNLDLLPADFSYRNMDLELDNAKRPTRLLRRLLTTVSDDYDVVFLDCPALGRRLQGQEALIVRCEAARRAASGQDSTATARREQEVHGAATAAWADRTPELGDHLRCGCAGPGHAGRRRPVGRAGARRRHQPL
jgi:hypothetical protein